MGNSNKSESNNNKSSNDPIKQNIIQKQKELSKLQNDEKQLMRNIEYQEKLTSNRSQQINIKNQIIELQQKDFNNTLTKTIKIEQLNSRIQALREQIQILEKKEIHIEKEIMKLSNNLDCPSDEIDEKTIAHKQKMKECFENELTMIQEETLEVETKITEAEDEHIDKETMKAMMNSDAVLQQTVNDNNKRKDNINDDMKIVSDTMNDAYDNATNEIQRNMDRMNDNIQNEMDTVTEEINEAINVISAQTEAMRASEPLLLERYKMYKLAAKNMKDKGDKTIAVQYLRQSKIIAKQIEDVRQNKVVLKSSVPQPLDDNENT